MTAPDQTEAAEEAITELARRIRMVCPPSLLADPEAFAGAFVRWQTDRNWRPWPRPAVITATRPGTPPEAHATDLAAAREACETASDKIHRKEDHA